MNISYLLQILWRRAWIILIIPILSGLTAYYFTKDMKKMYKSSAQISTGFTQKSDIQLSEERFNYRETLLKFNNLVETMKTELIMSMVSYKILLHDLEADVPFKAEGENIPQSKREATIELLKQKLEKFELLSNAVDDEMEILKVLNSKGYANWIIKKEIIIRRVGDTDFISIEYLTENPELTAFVVNTLAEETIRYNMFSTLSSSGSSLEFFSQQVEEKKKILDDKTKDLDDFRRANNIFDFDIETQTVLTQIAEQELQRQEAQKTIYGLQIEIANIDRKLSTYSTDVVRGNNSKILEIRKKINELNQIYIDGGSKDAQLRAAIDNLRDELQIEMKKLDDIQKTDVNQETPSVLKAERDRLQVQLDVSKVQLNSINLTIAELRGKVGGMRSSETQIVSLQKEVDNASEAYLNAVDKYNEAKSKAIVSSDNSISLLVRGQPNYNPVPSKSILIIAFAVIASGGLCIFVIILNEFLDQRIKTTSKFERLTKLKLAGSINQIKIESTNLLSIFDDPKSNGRHDTFKHLVRNIRFEMENDPSKVFLFTSLNKGTGKSFSIISLAFSLSLLNKKILIIDTNFRNNSLTRDLVAQPNMHKALNIHTDLKLLPGGDPEENGNGQNGHEPESIITRTTNANIDIIGSVPGMESPSEVFAGKDFKAVINQFGVNYDYIFLEGAAMNNYSDSKELINYVERVVPVFSANSTLKKLDYDSINYLNSLDGKLMGSILNNVEEENLKV